MELLKEFNDRNGITLRKPPSEKDKSAKKARRGGQQHQPIQLSRKLDRLQNLLDITRLKGELRDLEEAREVIKTKAYFTNSDTSSMVSTWTAHNDTHSVLGSFVNVLPDDQCALEGIFFYRLQHSVRILPGLAADSQKLKVILNVQQWEMCRSLIVVFDWCRYNGPATARCVLDCYRERGYEELKIQSPSLADFVNHIVWYVYGEQRAWVAGKKEATNAKRRKGRRIELQEQHSEQTTASDPRPPGFGNPPLNPRELPRDMCGLRPANNHQQPIHLPALRDFNGGTDELYARCKVALLNILSDELILPNLRVIDSTFSTTRRSNMQSSDILNRSLTRGATLQCIADACGSDAIFASNAVKEFLASPALLFEDRFSRDKVFANRVLADAVSTLEPLFSWITDHINETKDIPETAERIGNLVHLSMLELHVGHPLLEQSSTRQNTLDTMPLSRKTGQRRPKTHIFSEVSLPDLLPGRNTVGVGVIGLILREALGAHREHPTNNEILERVLQGKHATQSTSSSHNPDHTDPIRQYSQGANLLYHYLPGSKMTTAEGLANLLSWYGTGQGFKTKSYLKTVDHGDRFYAKDKTTMIDRFQRAISTNWYRMKQRGLLSQSDPKSKSQAIKLPELITTHDAHIWGQSSNHLALLPTHRSGERRGTKYTLDDKFGQYFTSEVEDQWTESLGDMLEQDPGTYTGERRSWSYYYRTIRELKIQGFQQGLTVFQLVNSLVFAGIAKMPHWSEIADFISENRSKGAFRGLEKLGFYMPDASSVRAAFYCIHHHLDKHLTEIDKKNIGFSPIFTEHVLCKVVRWAKHLDREANIDFYKMGQDAELKYVTWELGLNKLDPVAFPFPLTISMETLAEAVKKSVVCPIYQIWCIVN